MDGRIGDQRPNRPVGRRAGRIARGSTRLATSLVFASGALVAVAIGISSVAAPPAFATGSSWSAYITDYNASSSYSSNDVSIISNLESVPSPESCCSTVGMQSTSVPDGATMSPDGQYVFIGDYLKDWIYVYNASGTYITRINSNHLKGPTSMAVTPDGSALWVADYGYNGGAGNANYVSVFCIAAAGCNGGSVPQWGTYQEIGTSASNGITNPFDVAITPNGEYAYVSNFGSDTVSVFCAQSGGCSGTAQFAVMPFASSGGIVVTPVVSGSNLTGVDWTSFTPDGKYAFIADCGNQTCGTQGAIAFILNPESSNPTVHSFTTVNGLGTAQIDVMPSCSISACDAYVTNYNGGVAGGNVQVYSNADSGTFPTSPSTTISTGVTSPNHFSFTPDSQYLYLTDPGAGTSGQTEVISTSTHAVTKSYSTSFNTPWGIVVSPGQAPTGSFTPYPEPAGQSSYFDASGSTAPVGSVSSYIWNFGDGCTATTSSATFSFAFPTVNGSSCPAGTTGTVNNVTGPFSVSMTASGGGCGNAIIFTGHQVSCNGGSTATVTELVTLPAKLVVTSSPTSGLTSTTPNVGPITVQMQTSSGAAVVAPPSGGPTVTLSLSASPSAGALFSSWNGTSCNSTPTFTSVAFPAGSSTVSFCFGDNTAATYSLTLTTSGLTSATQSITVAPPGVYQIAFSSAATSALCLSPCGSGSAPNMGPITVETQNAAGAAANAGPGGQKINLTSSSATGIFSLYSGGACQAATITKVTIASGSSTAQICYGDTATGTPTLTGTTTGLTVNTMTQQETVTGPPHQLGFATSQESAQYITNTTPNMGPITIAVEDSNGNVTTTSVAQTITMSTTSNKGYFSLWNGASCSSTTQTTFTIAIGASSVQICYGDKNTGNPTLTATDSALAITTATQSEYITTGVPNKLVISTGAVSGTASTTPNLGPITIAVEDTNSLPTNATSSLTVSLSSSSGTGTFSIYSGGACGTTVVTSATIAAGSDSVQVCYGDPKVGTPTVTVSVPGGSLPGATSATQVETVQAGPPTVILFSSAALTDVASSTPNMGPIIIAIEDAFGNASPVSSNATVTLSSTSATGHFSAWNGASCNSAPTFTSTTISSGQSSVSVCYGDTTAGTPTVTASTTGLTVNSGTQTETINALSPDHLAVTTVALAGPKSTTPNLGPITIAIEDSFNNPTDPTNPETVTLSSTSGTGSFSLWEGTVCSASILSPATVTIAMGTTSTSICYGDSTNGTPTITASVSPTLPTSSSTTQVETIAAGEWINETVANSVETKLAGDYYGVATFGSDTIAVGDDGVTNNDPGGADFAQVSYQYGAGNFNVTRLFDGSTNDNSTASIDSTRSLTSISCPAPSFCAAVDGSGRTMTYNGTSWSVSSDVDGSSAFQSISCTSFSLCVAVDNAGHAYYCTSCSSNLFFVTAGTGDVTSMRISCLSTTLCVAVDANGKYLTYNQSTNTWSSPTATGDANSFQAITCIPSTTTCFAVDNQGNVISTTNGGSSWSAKSDIDGTNDLTSVTCPATNACTAVDSSGKVFTYNGTTWTNSASTGKTLLGVSCYSSTLCGAVDSAGDALFYDGASWTTDAVDSGNSLNAISCPTTSFCFAVDSAGNAVYVLGNGDTSGLTAGAFYGISCPSASLCITVGADTTYTHGVVFTTADPTDPNSWVQRTVPAAVADLFSISCPSATVCFAVGLGGASGTVSKGGAVIETTNGGVTWTDLSASMATAVPGGTVDDATGVACVSTTECYAAGFGYTGSTASGVLIYWNGTTWTVEAYTSSGGQLTGIACPSSSECIASGQSGTYSTVYVNTDAASSPGSWTQLFSTSSTAGYAYGIGCTGTTSCYAVGWTRSSGSFNGTATVVGALVLSGNPASAASWKVVENSNLGGGAAGSSVDTAWFGITCNAATCTVVGDNNQNPYYPMVGNGS